MKHNQEKRQGMNAQEPRSAAVDGCKDNGGALRGNGWEIYRGCGDGVLVGWGKLFSRDATLALALQLGRRVMAGSGDGEGGNGGISEWDPMQMDLLSSGGGIDGLDGDR